MRELRPYQQEALDALRDTIRQGVRRIACQAPTAAGKTLIAAKIAEGALRKGNRLAFTVPRIQLIDQTVEKFYEDGVDDVGVIQANHHMTDWSRPIQVCSIDTVRSKKKFPDCKIVIFDEGHILTKTHIQWMNEHPEVIFILLSATPWTRGLGKYFDTLLVISTTAELIEQGFLSPFRVFASAHPDLTNVKQVAGDYHEGQLSTAMQNSKLVADIIDTWKIRWNKPKTLCFAVDCLHAQLIQQRFIEAGVPCGYQDAQTPETERREIKRKFHTGELLIVVNIDTLTMGVDWDARCLILARPTRSEMRYVQIVGRVLRTAEGKDYATILDHSDTTERLGFVTDIHHDKLDDGKFRVKENKPRDRLPKECPECTQLMNWGTKVCPNCGHEMPKQKTSNIRERDGELVEHFSDGRRGKKGTRVYTYAEKEAFFAEAKFVGIEKGRKPGWAMYLYKEKFNEWPDDFMKLVQPRTAGIDVRRFIQYRNIAYAIAKNKQKELTP